MNGSGPACVFPRTWVCNQNQCSFICLRHLIWMSALLCQNNKPQAIPGICKNVTPSPTWTINIGGKIPWREIPIVKFIMWFSSMSFDMVWICAYLVRCAEHLPVFSTWNFSKIIYQGALHFPCSIKSIFCSLAFKVILLQKKSVPPWKKTGRRKQKRSC